VAESKLPARGFDRETTEVERTYMPIKIAMIGAGLIEFTRRLMQDALAL
jgi:hypothetical protein